MRTLAFLIVLTSGYVAGACPAILSSTKTEIAPGMTLCQAYDRYHQAVDALHAERNYQVRRTGNLMAPRFINLPDWMAKRTQRTDSALTIYKPAPTTWKNWELGATMVDSRAAQNVRSAHFEAVDLNWLVSLHKAMLSGLMQNPGMFRTLNNVGPQIHTVDALTKEQISGIQSIGYMQTLHPDHPLVNWIGVTCFEGQKTDFQAKAIADLKSGVGIRVSDWSPISNDLFFKDGAGQQRQCGYLKYGPHEEIAPEIERYLKFLNDETAAWPLKTGRLDPVRVAARAQRWMISIHPFYDGNGRMSRFMMDLALESLGLPAPILANMDNDVYSTEDEWTKQVGLGVSRAVLETEACAQNPSAIGCATIAINVGAPR